MKLVPPLALCACLAACGMDEPDTVVTEQASSGMQYGIVSGSIYADLAANPGARMGDIAGLGAKWLRVEIQREVDVSVYRTIVDTAHRYGIEVLALVQSNAIGELPLEEDIEVYAQHINAKIDQLVAQIPGLKYIEVENEPDGYDFRLLDGDHPQKLGLLMVRVFEHAFSNRTWDQRPQIVGFDFSRPDQPAFQAVYDSPAITNHRNWRPSVGLRDGLPVDIVSIHAYGDKTKLPSEPGYSYGGTMRDGLNVYFGQTFSNAGPDGNRSLFNGTPVWVTEIGFGWSDIGGLDRQAAAISEAMSILRDYPVQVAFAYDYRDDDESGGKETAGLRGNGSTGFAKHPSYETYRSVAGGRGQTFWDVPTDYWTHDEIESLFAKGVTVGCQGTGYSDPNLAFCPDRDVSQTEVDVFLARAQGQPGGVPAVSPAETRGGIACKLGNAVGASAPYRGTFVDVNPSTPCMAQIEGLHDRGIARGSVSSADGRLYFYPDDHVKRSEMAAFLSRAFDLK